MNTTSPDRTTQDDQILDRLRHSDPEALAALVHAYAEWLVESATHVVHAADTAQDVVQEVFAWVWDHRTTLEVRTTLAAYLYRAVHNRALTSRVQERSRLHLNTVVFQQQRPHDINRGESALRAADLRSAIDRALLRLQPRMREVFLMRAEQEMSYEEIADALEISVATAYKQMYRATTQLAEMLQAE